MKRVFIIFATVCLLMVSVSSLAEFHDEFVKMSVEELESVIQDATQVLEEKKASPTSEKKDDGVESMNEGIAELSDENFIKDMSSGLKARWDIVYAKSDADYALMSDKQYVDFFSSAIAAEMSFVNKYNDYEFKDSKLGEYAHAYLLGVQNQYIAISEYYLTSENMYNEMWNDGVRTRLKSIYSINKAYGLNIPSKYNEQIYEFVSLGQIYNYIDSVEALLTKEMENKELSFEIEKDSVTIKPFNIYNESSLSIPGLSMDVHFIKDDIEVFNNYLVSYKDLNPGKSISTDKVWVYDQHFDSFYYTFSYNLNMNGYFEMIEGKIMPAVQYSWDGKLKKAGKLAEGQPDYKIEDVISGWEEHTSWSKTLYVPAVKFRVKNSGTGNAKDVTVKCVFFEGDGNEIWDEEVVYVVDSSEKPLEPGYSKQVFVYSSVGYTKRPTFTPAMKAEVYINDQLVETIQISK